ncbi:CHAP domain-containing protein [Ruminococcus sp.]|uniref:CHAP domain-containing protein n=1 Tax=Ruminococcus sp. TaxID=41978 RepID=UPI00388D09E3
MAVNADKIISIARSQIGTKATNIKKCKYNTWYYGTVVSGSGYDWCETFVQWVFNEAGASSLLYTKTANCGYAAKAFQDHGRLKLSGFQRGDVVFFHWTDERSTLVPGTYVSDHVGIIESVNGDNTITTIEGNTGPTANGEVMRRVRSLSVVSCAGRPAYGGSPAPSQDYPKAVYRVRSAGRWLPFVTDLGDYAGITGKAITDVAIKVTEGSVRYRVHVRGGGWLPYVTGCDVSDSVSGYAGNGRAIDAIEVYYSTPGSVAAEYGWLKAKYRVAPIGNYYYPWQYDNETASGQDGYAGIFGRQIDWFQMTLSN